MENKDKMTILGEHPLFRSCPDTLLARLSQDAQTLHFASGDALKSYDERPFLCIIISGEVTVHTKDESNDLLLRVLGVGDTFGVANLFGHEPMVTRVTAHKSTTALCISEEAMRKAITADGELAMRYITFLSDRIRFLNRRISTLSAGSAERRLAAWLDAVIPENADRYEFSMPMSRLADTLGVGRASLYRAFDDLTTAGYLQRDGKILVLIDRAAMRRGCGLT